MKKTTKKLLALALAMLMLCTLAACAGDSKSDNTQPQDIVYEFTGAYDSTQSDVYIPFVLTMTSDGNLKVEPGVVFLDLEEYDAQATGKWSESNGTISFNIDSVDGSFSNSYVMPLENGGYQFVMQISASGYRRPITMTCNINGFVPKEPSEASEPSKPAETTPVTEPQGMDDNISAEFNFVNGTGSMAAAMKLFEDGTVVANYDMVSMSYTLYTATGTWTMSDDGNYVVSLNADDDNEAMTLTSTEEDGVYSIQWVFNYTAGGNTSQAERTLTYTPAE